MLFYRRCCLEENSRQQQPSLLLGICAPAAV